MRQRKIVIKTLIIYIFCSGNSNVCCRRHIFELDGEGIKNSTDVATHHVALEAGEYFVRFNETEETTHVRDCVTLKSPGKIELGNKEKVRK